MTDSNINSLLDNNQEEETNQELNIDSNTQTDILEDANTDEITNVYKNKNVLDQQEFSDFGSFDFDDSANTFYLMVMKLMILVVKNLILVLIFLMT